MLILGPKMVGVKNRESIFSYVASWIAALLTDKGRQSYDFILSPDGNSVPEDLSPSLLKLGVLPDGYVIHSVTGIRTHIIRRLDGKGYDIRKCEM